jgi:hypothetical protein
MGKGYDVDVMKQVESQILLRDAASLTDKNEKSKNTESNTLNENSNPANIAGSKNEKDKRIEIIVNGESKGFLDEITGTGILANIGMPQLPKRK